MPHGLPDWTRPVDLRTQSGPPLYVYLEDSNPGMIVTADYKGLLRIKELDTSIGPNETILLYNNGYPGEILGGFIRVFDSLPDPSYLTINYDDNTGYADSFSVQDMIDNHINRDGDFPVYLEEYDATNNQAFLKFTRGFKSEDYFHISMTLKPGAPSSAIVVGRVIYVYRTKV